MVQISPRWTCRTRGTPCCNLAQQSVHANWSCLAWLFSRAWISLHDIGVGLGIVCLRYYDHDSWFECVCIGQLSRSKSTQKTRLVVQWILKFSKASGEVACWLNFARTAGGFIVSYFQVVHNNVFLCRCQRDRQLMLTCS
jgi:hypothetical protein